MFLLHQIFQLKIPLTKKAFLVKQPAATSASQRAYAQCLITKSEIKNSFAIKFAHKK